MFVILPILFDAANILPFALPDPVGKEQIGSLLQKAPPESKVALLIAPEFEDSISISPNSSESNFPELSSNKKESLSTSETNPAAVNVGDNSGPPVPVLLKLITSPI